MLTVFHLTARVLDTDSMSDCKFFGLSVPSNYVGMEYIGYSLMQSPRKC